MKTRSELVGNHETPAEPETTGVGSVLDINGEPIDAVWAAEFRGFFWGEGMLGMYVHQPHALEHPDRIYLGYSYQVIAVLTARTDDAAVLREFQRRLGGTVKQRKGSYTKANGIVCTTSNWRAANWSDCERVGRLLESPTGLPFRKAQQLALWREANDIRRHKKAGRSTPYTRDESERMHQIAAEVRRLKEWAG